MAYSRRMKDRRLEVMDRHDMKSPISVVCCVPDCNNQSAVKDHMCDMHAKRWDRYGTVHPSPQVKRVELVKQAFAEGHTAAQVAKIFNLNPTHVRYFYKRYHRREKDLADRDRIKLGSKIWPK